MMKKNLCRFARLFPLPLLAASLLVASCSSDDSNSPNQQPDPEQPASRPIYVEVSENQIINTAEARQMTRAAITELSTLEKFKMTANTWTDEYRVKKNNGKWILSENNWPIVADDNTSVTFYAYSADFTDAFDKDSNIGVDFYPNNGDPYISFKVEEGVSGQIDLLVADTAFTFNAHKGKVFLAFNHACAALDFTIALTANAAAKGSVVMKSATLYNVKNKGNFYFNDNEGKGAWKSQTTVITEPATQVAYTLESTGEEEGISLSTTPHRLACNYIFMIPQTLTAWNKSGATDGTYIDVVLSVSGGGGDKTVRFPFPKELKAGEYYPIDIVIGTAAKDTGGYSIFTS